MGQGLQKKGDNNNQLVLTGKVVFTTRLGLFNAYCFSKLNDGLTFSSSFSLLLLSFSFFSMDEDALSGFLWALLLPLSLLRRWFLVFSLSDDELGVDEDSERR